ncbi:MAG: hypothetical protein COB71_11190, partial [Thiotrichales bacterium]
MSIRLLRGLLLLLERPEFSQRPLAQPQQRRGVLLPAGGLDADEAVAVQGQQQGFIKRPAVRPINQVSGAGGDVAFQIEQPFLDEAQRQVGG